MKILAIALLSVMFLSGCASSGLEEFLFNKNGEVAGSGGLKAAKEKCANKKGTQDWPSCVAQYDGLYTENSDGSIERNYVRRDGAPAPSGKVETCTMRASWDSRKGEFKYTPCVAP